MITNAFVRAVAICPGCKARTEYDSVLQVDLDQESDSYGRSTTRAVVDLSPPVGWYVERLYASTRFWCSFECAKKHPHPL